jgi:hypothetical protein
VPARHHLLVFSNPSPGREAEYNDWYDTRHVPELLALPEFVAVQRFRLDDIQPRGEHPHRYLAIWEIETDDLAAAMARLKAAQADGSVARSDAFDYATSLNHMYQPLAPKTVTNG